MDQLIPRVVSWDDLTRSLSPFLDKRSLITDLYDLWLMGAPIPNNNPDAPEKRVLLPTQFQAWWINMSKRHCLNPDPEWYAGKVRPKEGG